MNTLLIGFGNPLRRDDGVGFLAAQALEQQGYQALALFQPLPELALELAKAQKVVLLDADCSLPAGQIGVRPAQAVSGQPNHALTPEGLLALSESLGLARPRVWLLSLGIEDLGLGEGFSPKVEAAFPQYLRLARSLAEGLCTTGNLTEAPCTN